MNAKGTLFMMTTLAALAAPIGWRERAPLPLPRTGYAIGIVGGRLTLAGGSYWVDGVKQRAKRVDRFDPAANAWSAGPELPLALSDLASAEAGGALYAIGGTAGEAARREVLRLKDGRWELWPHPLPAARMNASATSDGRYLYVTGGLAVIAENASATRTVWRIDTTHPEHGWETLAELPGAGRFTHTAVWAAGALYVFGGCHAEGAGVKNLDHALRLDPATGKWTELAPLPTPRRALGSGAEAGRILLFGGYTDTFLNEIVAFDPATGKYAPAGHLPGGVADAKFVHHAGRWYTAGGEIGMKIRGASTWESDAH